MSTFAQIVTAVASRCSVGDVTSVVGQTGDAARVVRNARDAWLEIQQISDDWRWMRSRFSFQTVAAKAAYTPAEVLGVLGAFVRKWRTEEQSIRCFKTSIGKTGESMLGMWPWHDYEDVYELSVTQPGQPQLFAVRNDNALALGPTPDGVYTISGWYQRTAQILAADGDVPELPAEFHTIIEHKATMKYSVGDNAPETYSEAKGDYDVMLANLRRVQLPELTFGGPLA